MSNISAQLDPTLRSVESLEFEIELRIKSLARRKQPVCQ